MDDYLAHHGIKGQKWGDRRFQNSDGSLTPEGKLRYGISEAIKKGKTKIQERDERKLAKRDKFERRVLSEKAKAKVDEYHKKHDVHVDLLDALLIARGASSAIALTKLAAIPAVSPATAAYIAGFSAINVARLAGSIDYAARKINRIQRNKASTEA